MSFTRSAIENTLHNGALHIKVVKTRHKLHGFKKNITSMGLVKREMLPNEDEFT